MLLKTTAVALPLPNLIGVRGDVQEFKMKMGNGNPISHPNTIRQQEAVEWIIKEMNS